MPSRHSCGGSAPLPADPGPPPAPKTETPPLPPGRRRGCSPAAATRRGRAPLPRPQPGPHLPPPAGSQRGGAGLCGAEGGYTLRRGGQQGRPRSHPPAGSLKAEGWRPRSRLSAEPGGGEGKRGKSDPSARSLPRPSLGGGSALLPAASAGAAAAPAPPRSPGAPSPCGHAGKRRCFLPLPGSGDQQV